MPGGIFYIVERTPEPPAPQWYDYTDISYWTVSGNGSWDGSEYDVTNDTITLTPTGGWEVGFRPTKVRITWTEVYSGGVALTINTGILSTSHTMTNPILEETLDFSSGDIDDLVFDGNVKNAQYEINKIEFFA